jgi:hypothetical protein
MSLTRPSPVLAHALPLPIFKLLKDRRVILASSSPRRKDILEVAVRFLSPTLRLGLADLAGFQTRDRTIHLR